MPTCKVCGESVRRDDVERKLRRYPPLGYVCREGECVGKAKILAAAHYTRQTKRRIKRKKDQADFAIVRLPGPLAKIVEESGNYSKYMRRSVMRLLVDLERVKVEGEGDKREFGVYVGKDLLGELEEWVGVLSRSMGGMLALAVVFDVVRDGMLGRLLRGLLEQGLQAEEV